MEQHELDEVSAARAAVAAAVREVEAAVVRLIETSKPATEAASALCDAAREAAMASRLRMSASQDDLVRDGASS